MSDTICDLCHDAVVRENKVEVCCECGRVFCSGCGDAPTMLCDECREAILKRAVAERDELKGANKRLRDEISNLRSALVGLDQHKRLAVGSAFESKVTSRKAIHMLRHAIETFDSDPTIPQIEEAISILENNGRNSK